MRPQSVKPQRSEYHVELVGRELWWSQQVPECPPDMDRWRSEARRLEPWAFNEMLAQGLAQIEKWNA